MKTLSLKKQGKLKAEFPHYLTSKRKALITSFGEEKTNEICRIASLSYPDIVNVQPVFKTPMYDSLITLGGKMAALKKGMRAAGIGTDKFVKFSICQTRRQARKIPAFLRGIIGKIYLSWIMQVYLKNVAKSVSANGWPTRLIRGKRNDDFAMSVETRNCQMIAFFETVGEGDIRPYCTFFDFAAAEALGVGLEQISSIDSGICKYCFYRKGQVKWPKAISRIMKN